MARDIVNLYAESDRGIISDDTSAVLTIENTATGAGLVATNSSAAGTAGPAIIVKMPATSAPTVANLRSINSVASGAHFEFQGFLASTASMGSIVRGIRVKYGNNYGWVPIYASATYI